MTESSRRGPNPVGPPDSDLGRSAARHLSSGRGGNDLEVRHPIECLPLRAAHGGSHVRPRLPSELRRAFNVGARIRSRGAGDGLLLGFSFIISMAWGPDGPSAPVRSPGATSVCSTGSSVRSARRQRLHPAASPDGGTHPDPRQGGTAALRARALASRGSTRARTSASPSVGGAAAARGQDRRLVLGHGGRFDRCSQHARRRGSPNASSSGSSMSA